MKRIIYLVLVVVVSCQGKKTPDESAPADHPDESAWLVYEGRVPLDEETCLYIEVSMLPSTHMGEGSFDLKEYVEADGSMTQVSSFKGKYSTLYGETPEEQVVQFHQTAQEQGVKRSYLRPGFQGDFQNSQIKMIREEMFRKQDLTVRPEGKNKLLLLDDNMTPISLDPQFNLNRRTSKLFTVEGYFRHNGDTAEFLEMNTRERWAVTKLGSYHQAIRQYHALTSRKFEVTYLKGIGYSIRHVDSQGFETEALVLKTVLQMSASPEVPGGNDPMP